LCDCIVGHTKGPSDPQVSEIERLWAASVPDEPFNEGGDLQSEETSDQAVIRWGEPGLVRFLAKRDGIPVHSLDPSRTLEVADLLDSFSARQVKLFFILRAVSECGRIYQGTTQTKDEEVKKRLALYAAIPGSEGEPRSVPRASVNLHALFSESGKCYGRAAVLV
jgi:hypothetical protein